MITVWPDKMQRGWEGETPTTVRSFPTLSLDGLGVVHDTDAHFVPYHVCDTYGNVLPEIPRINKAALVDADGLVPGDLMVTFTVIVLDVDDPEKSEGVARAPWWESESEKLRLSGAAWYRTRGGYRVLWSLPRPFGPVEYEGLHVRVRKHARAEWGIVADDNAGDWTRCYRLPFVVRDGETQNWPASLSNVTTLDLDGLASMTARRFSGLASALKGGFDLPEEIEGGDRHTTLFRYAGVLWRQGKTQEEVLAALLEANEDHCVPPMSDVREIERMARGVSRYARPEPPPRKVVAPPEKSVDPPPPEKSRDPNNPRFALGSEVEISEHAEDDLGADTMYDRGRFWRYATSGIWEGLNAAEIRTEISKYDGEFVFSGRDRDGNPKVKPLKMSHAMIKGVAGVLQDRISRDGYFDAAPAGVSFCNGFAGLGEGDQVVVTPLAPSNRSTFGLAHDYVRAACPELFLRFLGTCFEGDRDAPDKIALLQEWVGAALCGLGTTYAKALALAGSSGANGKSTFLSIISALFPAESRTAIAPQSMTKEYERARLSRARLNVVSELPEQDVIDSESVKAIFSGDVISGREIYCAPFDFRPLAAHLFAANLLPSVRDVTPAFWRRWIVVPFDRHFAPHERILGLDQQIIDQEIGLIASWALDGAARLSARGRFQIPVSCEAAKDKWREESNPVIGWLGLCETTQDPQKFTKSQSVFLNFSRYAETTKSGTRLSSTKFGRRLRALGVEKHRKNDGIYWGLMVPTKF